MSDLNNNPIESMNSGVDANTDLMKKSLINAYETVLSFVSMIDDSLF